MAPRLGVAVQVGHFAGEALIEPIAQLPEGIRLGRGGDAGQFKAQRVRLGFEAVLQGMSGRSVRGGMRKNRGISCAW